MVLYVDGTELEAGGITEADQWRMTTTFSASANPIASNWERIDTDGGDKMGTGMTESSGLFTFPSTGYWMITFFGSMNSSVGGTYWMASIETSTDGSNYNIAARGDESAWDPNTNAYMGHASTSFLFDVTNTSTHLVRFVIEAQGSLDMACLGNSTYNFTHANFVRLGDT